MSNREAFLAERKTGIGSSDMTDLFNLPSPYKGIPQAAGCVRRLYFDKTSTPPDFPRIEKPSMSRGTDCEEIVARKLAEREGWRLVRRPMLRNPAAPWLVAHIDREVQRRKGYGPGAAELKTMNGFVAKKVAKEGLSDGYLLQMQHILLTANFLYRWGCFGVHDVDAWDLLPTIYAEPDYAVQPEIAKRARWLWRECVEPRIPPPRPDGREPGDPRCSECQWRKTCFAGEGETNGNGNS